MRKATIRKVKHILAAGSIAAVAGVLAAFFVYLAGDILFRIPSFVGYEAVISFAFAILFLAAALVVVFICGVWINSSGKFSK